MDSSSTIINEESRKSGHSSGVKSIVINTGVTDDAIEKDQNDNSVTSDETNSTDQTCDSKPTIESDDNICDSITTNIKETGMEDELNYQCNVENEISVPPNEDNADLTTGSISTIDKEISPQVISKNEECDQDGDFVSSTVFNSIDQTSDQGRSNNDIDNIRIVDESNNDLNLQPKCTQEDGLMQDSDNSYNRSQEEDENLDDTDDNYSEVSSVDEGDKNRSDCADDATDDVYALLAMSKKRLSSGKRINDEDTRAETSEEKNWSGIGEIHDLDVKNDDRMKDDMHNEENKNTDENNVLEKNNDEGLSFSSAKSNHGDAVSSHEKDLLNSKQEVVKKKKEKHNAELWDLLKYSQLRLSSGAIPTIAEAEIEEINVDIEEGLSYADDEIPASASQCIDSKPTMTGIEEDDLSLADEDGSKEWSNGIDENARARALETLAMVSDRNVRSSDREVRLSEKQLEQSVWLAEEAARTGANEFSTRRNLSALDRVQVTDNFRMRRAENARNKGHSGARGTGSTPFKDKFVSFKMKCKLAFDDFKKTCDRASTVSSRR